MIWPILSYCPKADFALCFFQQEPWQSYCVEPPCGQLNLANENMYNILGTIYKEFAKVFAPLQTPFPVGLGVPKWCLRQRS